MKRWPADVIGFEQDYKFKRNSNILTCCILFLLMASCQVKVERRNQLTDANISIENFHVSREIGSVTKDSIRLFANGKIKSDKFPLQPKTYTLLIYGRGTQAYNVYPKISIYLNDQAIGVLQLGKEYSYSAVTFKANKQDLYQLTIQFDSDGLDDKGNDRDVYLKAISLREGEISSVDLEKMNSLKTAIVPVTKNDSILTISDFNVDPGIGIVDADSVIHIMSNGAVKLREKFPLDAGDYTLFLEAKGTPAYEVYPKIKILVNGQQVSEVQLLQNYVRSTVPVKIERKGVYDIWFVFDSDGLDDKGNDRDVLIKSTGIEKK